MAWQKQRKYVRFKSDYPHYQVEKFNGTKGNVIIEPDNIGVFNEITGNYDFKPVKDLYTKNYVAPCFLGDFINHFLDSSKILESKDSRFDGPFNDEDDKSLHERLEVRLWKANSQLEVDCAFMFFNAGQIDRLSIKASLMRLNEINQ